ncbi:hypothetical protein [Streptomyces sp. TP-A0874]|uniref:hypothetical protein n=1 Tax=Streptomyces sp. TP-A0874 TaxID=549819 RepID=UPI000852B1F2|nr:hypothetical protein [Streptomyces sp. TP-A0874]
MARRPLPRILTSAAPSGRGRAIVRTAGDGAGDVLHPLLVISRGLRRLASAGRRGWSALPRQRRGPAVLLGAGCLLAVALLPHGPQLAFAALMLTAAWAGREGPRSEPGRAGEESERLAALYEALIPSFSAPEDPDPLYAHGGDWRAALTPHSFDEDGRPTRLELRYPAYFPDGEPTARGRIEHLLSAKCGRGREYLFDWDEEGNRLTVSVLPPLAGDICAQRFVTAPGETVLGFTDPAGAERSIPVVDPEHGTERQAFPVLWRTGPRPAEPHLAVLGRPGSGTSTLLRSVALQALVHGDVLVVDGGGHGDHACLAGRLGVAAVVCDLDGALSWLEWAARETERRLRSAHRAHRLGHPRKDAGRPLWILLDRPALLGHLAEAQGRTDPRRLLDTPLRHGRAANVTVVVADRLETAANGAGGGWGASTDQRQESLLGHCGTRVVLGPVSAARLEEALGVPPHTTPPAHVPPGRGYVRSGYGPVQRLQVPATPDPYDQDSAPARRRAVLALLPERARDDGVAAGAEG